MSSADPRIYLSSPHMGGDELPFVQEAFATNWIAPIGPHVDQFEREFAELIGKGGRGKGSIEPGALSYERCEAKKAGKGEGGGSIELGALSDERCDAKKAGKGGSVGAPLQAAALSSGTAALHLALRWLGLQPGDEVICSTLTFSASANPILYERATPVFVDSDESWNMSPDRLAEAVQDCLRRGRKPKAVIVVHLYGQSADLDPIVAICAEHGIPLIEDAAEALGAVYWGSRGGEGRRERGGGRESAVARGGWRQETGGGGFAAQGEGRQEKGEGRREKGGAANNQPPTTNPQPPTTNPQQPTANYQQPTANLQPPSHPGISPGTVGLAGIFSFNGNKIITTSGGGMLVSANAALIDKARFWATQARDPAPHYQHSEVGFNYRLSNVLAGIGRGQLRVLADRVEARRRNCAFYQAALADLPGLAFMPEADYGRCTRWLTCITIDPAVAGVDREKIRLALADRNIEARPVWKPMHQQPIFRDCRCVGGSVADRLFANGLCLPSGSNLSESDLSRVVDGIRKLVASH